MRQIPLLAAALLLLGACAAPPATQTPEPGATAPAAVAAAPTASTDRGTFSLQQGGTTVISEQFTRTANRLEGELSAPGQGRLVYAVILAPDAAVERVEARSYIAGADSVTQRSTAVFRGDSVFTENVTGDSTQARRVATTRGAVLYVNPSPSLMEQIVRRARVLGGDTVQVPVFVAGSGGQTASATVAFLPPDSATLTLAGTEARLRVDETGRLLGGSVPAQNLSIVREAASTP